MKIMEWFDSLRRNLFHAGADKDEVSWMVHFALVLAGTLAPAYIVYAVFGMRLAVLTWFVFSEAWLLFMACREVADYMRHQRDGADMDRTWKDGWGDLIGPLLVHVFGWIGFLWLIFGGA